MKITKFKSSLLTTTLISTSLFGSKPNPGTLHLPREKQQEILQTHTQEDLLSPILKNFLIDFFNRLPKIKEIQKTYFLNYNEWLKGHDKYEKKIAKTGCGSYSFRASRILTREDFFKQAVKQYTEIAKTVFEQQAKEFLSSLEIEGDPWWISVIIKPFLSYSFFDLIGLVSNLDLFEVFQEEVLYDINQKKEFFIGDLCCFLLSTGKFYLDNDNRVVIFREMLICLLNKYADIYNIQDLKECLVKYFKAREAVIQQNKITQEIENIQKEFEEKKHEFFLLPLDEKLGMEADIFNITQRFKEITLAHPQEKLFENIIKTITESQKAARELIKKIVEQLSSQGHASKKSQKHKPISKTQPSFGRKAIQSSSPNPIEGFKQIKQAHIPKTLADLDAKFGEDLTNNLNELESIEINFDSEEDWEKFIDETNVEFTKSNRDGSHESQEIFFDFEGQKTKGQLLIYHVHGKDSPEQRLYKIRVTRRVQK